MKKSKNKSPRKKKWEKQFVGAILWTRECNLERPDVLGDKTRVSYLSREMVC